MSVSNDFLHYVLEQLGQLGGVVTRRMFGGVGLYHEELFFGLLDDDTLYLKVNDSNRPDYVERGMQAFCPYPGKPGAAMGYFEVPADVLEDASELAAWARKSVSVALAVRAASGKAVGKPSKKRKTSG